MTDKKKIYLLHGWTYATEKWKPFLNALHKTGIETEVLRIPGLTGPLDTVWDLDDYVKWLEKSLAHEKNKVMLLGHSNGGRISLAFAAKHVDRVEKLILIDSAGIYHNNLPIRLKRTVFRFLAKTGKKITTASSFKQLFYKLVREHDYEKASPVMKQTMQYLISKDLSPLLPAITLPVCIIWGSDDRITPISDGNKMQLLLPHATLHLIQGGGHSPQFSHAQEVADIVRTFVK